MVVYLKLLFQTNKEPRNIHIVALPVFFPSCVTYIYICMTSILSRQTAATFDRGFIQCTQYILLLMVAIL